MRLAAIRAMQDGGDAQKARAMLDILAQEARDLPDGGAAFMGPLTALALPRRLHAALLRQAKLEGDAVARAGYRFSLVPPPSLLARHGRQESGARHPWTTASRAPVPRHIHQIWIGPKDAPPATRAWASHAAARGYGYTLWREAQLEAAGISGDATFRDRLERGDYPGAVDVARYILLERMGGIYLDCDWYPARDDIGFDDLLPMTGLTAMAEDVPRDLGPLGSVLFYNSFIASPAGHPVFRRILDALPEIAREMPEAPAWWATGPLIFTLAARAGSVSLAPPSLIAANLPQAAPETEIAALRETAQARDTGLLIAWKSWN